jgi:hypothetical protein
MGVTHRPGVRERPDRRPARAGYLARLITLAVALLAALPAPVLAHELPVRVVVRMIAAADADRVELMVRVPLEAMRDVDFPLTPQGYLQIDEARDSLVEAAGLWIVDGIVLRAGGAPVAPAHVEVRLGLPGDRAFADAAAARRHFAGPPLDPATRIYWRQALLDVRVAAPLGAGRRGADLTLDVALRHLGATTRVELLILDEDGETHALTFDGDAAGVALKPGPLRVARQFVADGVVHILAGIDHLLFLVCLVLPIRRFWPLVKAVTAFTLAHSVTLLAAALGWVPGALWFPGLVESLIAFSIVYLAVENVLRERCSGRWVSALLFGLVHGFGFASALGESLAFAQGHRLVALASFNVGVEVGQLAVLLVLVPVARLLMRAAPSRRTVTIVVSVLVGHTAWHWMIDRLEVLSGYFF